VLTKKKTKGAKINLRLPLFCLVFGGPRGALSPRKTSRQGNTLSREVTREKKNILFLVAS